MLAVPRTENPQHGFYGAMRSAGFDPDAAWTAALPIIASFYVGAHPRIAAKRARIFLDSSGGRHLADAIAHRSAVAPAVRAVLHSFHGWMR